MAADWPQLIRQGNLTVKGVRASETQAQLMSLIVVRTARKGGDLESAAGAIATAIQESTMANLLGGDRDSAGLYQQRASWGSYAERTDSVWAIDKFLSVYLPYRQRGYGWLEASHRTQRSAYPEAPQQWYGEALRAAGFFSGSGQASVTSGVGVALSGENAQLTVTREKPYEFTRGSVDGGREHSWDASGRLAAEVQWPRFFNERDGAIWMVPEEWLLAQPPRYRLSERSRGVQSISFEFEGRLKAAEVQMQVIAGKYDLVKGDRVDLFDLGPADGKWLVQSTRLGLQSPVMDVTLKRANASLPEPAPETEEVTTTISPGGTMHISVPPVLGGRSPSGDNVRASSIEEASRMVTKQFPALVITSTTGGTHATHSLHYQGRAHDLGADAVTMRQAAKWINESGLWRSLAEGIHNSGLGGDYDLSVDNGKRVPASFWGAETWINHRNHLHIGV